MSPSSSCQAAPSSAGRGRVDVGHGRPVGLLQLDGAADGVAEHEGPFLAGGQHDHHVPGRVPGGGHRGQAGGDGGVAVDRGHPIGLGQSPQTLVDVVEHEPAPLVHEQLPVGRTRPDVGIGEHRRPVLLPEEPAAVVDVEVRADDEVDVVGARAGRGQLVEEAAAHEPVVAHHPDAGVDQDRLRPTPHQEGSQWEPHHTVGVEQVLVTGEVGLGPEVLRRGDELPVRQAGDVEVPDAHPSILAGSVL